MHKGVIMWQLIQTLMYTHACVGVDVCMFVVCIRAYIHWHGLQTGRDPEGKRGQGDEDGKGSREEDGKGERKMGWESDLHGEYGKVGVRGMEEGGEKRTQRYPRVECMAQLST